MPRSPRRQVVVLLTREEWRALEALATEAERDPYQQARWLLVRALRESETPPAELELEPERAELAV
jgi:hypothetical protein